jgi:hypothetical protein
MATSQYPAIARGRFPRHCDSSSSLPHCSLCSGCERLCICLCLCLCAPDLPVTVCPRRSARVREWAVSGGSGSGSGSGRAPRFGGPLTGAGRALLRHRLPRPGPVAPVAPHPPGRCPHRSSSLKAELPAVNFTTPQLDPELDSRKTDFPLGVLSALDLTHSIAARYPEPFTSIDVELVVGLRLRCAQISLHGCLVNICAMCLL